MTATPEIADDITLFSARLTPHRSLSELGFFVLMVTVTAVSFAAGLVFLAVGAWPVFGFFGLDVLLIYWAFRTNYRSARGVSEEITVTATSLTVRRTWLDGAVQQWTLNPRWIRLESEADPEFGLYRLALISRGESLTVAACLGPQEKRSFAAALLAALDEAKRRPTRTVFAESRA